MGHETKGEGDEGMLLIPNTGNNESIEGLDFSKMKPGERWAWFMWYTDKLSDSKSTGGRYQKRNTLRNLRIMRVGGENQLVQIRQNGKLDKFGEIKDWREGEKNVIDIFDPSTINRLKKVTKKDTSQYKALTSYHDMLTGSKRSGGDKNKQSHFNPQTDSSCWNLLFFGAPGTGKSYTMNQWVLGEDVENLPHPIEVAHAERVTFYADYLHAQFFGSYKPTMAEDENGHRVIEYAFKPGPFLRVLVWALNHPGENENAVLVIEELNRAEAASVFGDLFQLLDRNDKGISQYPIAVSEDVKEYLRERDEKDETKLTDKGCETLKNLVGQVTGNNSQDCDCIVIPPNMFIWATMNSADQGVFPLDTAFKRRWSFKYFPIDEGENDSEWNNLRKAINKTLLGVGINEDKCMGPYFLGLNSENPNDSDNSNDSDNPDIESEFNEAIKNKVIMYLFEDAARYHRDKIFNQNNFKQGNTSLSKLFAAWDKGDIFKAKIDEVFSTEVVSLFNSKDDKQSDGSNGNKIAKPNEDGNKQTEAQESDPAGTEQNQDQTADNE